MAESFKSWAVLELMGHRRLIGECAEVDLAGGRMVRVDVPSVAGSEPFSQFYGSGAIFCLTPVSEDVARRLIERERPEPFFAWELRQAALPAPEADFAEVED
jgi:hypothetical protein